MPINVVSRYWNITIPMSEATENAKKYAGFGGSIMIEGIELAERHGLACKIIHSDLSTIKKTIDAGIPPIVILPGIPEITQHASVISGYDDDTLYHYVQKGTQEGQQQEGAIPIDVFNREWSEEGHLLIILAPPDAFSSLDVDESDADANRLCFVSERFNIQNNHAAALDSLKKALGASPSNPNALQMYAAMLNTQNSNDCIQFYEKCLGINERCYLAYNGLGNYYLKLDKFETAESYYTKAIGINPKRSAKIYKNRAYLREKQHKNSQAKDDLQTYLKLYPAARDRGMIERAIRQL